ERPGRPIPSSRVSVAQARILAITLSGAGFFVAAISPSSAIVAGALLICILAYNALLKATIFGPIAMGSCRFLNVLLGFSVISFPALSWLAAAIVGVYIVGITVFARREAGRSRQYELVTGTILMYAALATVVALPVWND